MPQVFAKAANVSGITKILIVRAAAKTTGIRPGAKVANPIARANAAARQMAATEHALQAAEAEKYVNIRNASPAAETTNHAATAINAIAVMNVNQAHANLNVSPIAPANAGAHPMAAGGVAHQAAAPAKSAPLKPASPAAITTNPAATGMCARRESVQAEHAYQGLPVNQTAL